MSQTVCWKLLVSLNTSKFNLHPMWFGFRANYKTRVVVVGAVFFGLDSARDMVNHKVLLTKLSTFKFSPLAL